MPVTQVIEAYEGTADKDVKLASERLLVIVNRALAEHTSKICG